MRQSTNKSINQSYVDRADAYNSPRVLACDALYLCAGLGAYTVKEHMDFLSWFQAFLAPALEALVSTMRAKAEQVRFQCTFFCVLKNTYFEVYGKGRTCILQTVV